MAAAGHLRQLRQGVATWNGWRRVWSDLRPNLRGANLNGLALPGPGDYRVVISMQGQDVKTLGCTVQPLAAQPRQPPIPPTTGTAGYL